LRATRQVMPADRTRAPRLSGRKAVGHCFLRQSIPPEQVAVEQQQIPRYIALDVIATGQRGHAELVQRALKTAGIGARVR
jgi:hypothetical protein